LMCKIGLFISMTEATWSRSNGSFKKIWKVSVTWKVRGFYGIWVEVVNTNWRTVIMHHLRNHSPKVKEGTEFSWNGRTWMIAILQNIRCPLHVPSARLTLPSTKLCTKFKILRTKIFFWYEGYLVWGIFKHFPKFEGHTSPGRHTNKTLQMLTKLWSFKVIWTFFGAHSWPRCAPVDGLTKNVAKLIV
jgi:hypothetical protein